MTMMSRIAAAMGCVPADDDDLVEAVRLLVAERDGARAELEATERARRGAASKCARLRMALAEERAALATVRAELEATERARQAAEEERDAALELVAPDAVQAARARDDRDAARLAALASLRVALADADLILEERERQLAAALAAVADERARCEAVCREAALACADEVERGRAPHSSRGNA